MKGYNKVNKMKKFLAFILGGLIVCGCVKEAAADMVTNVYDVSISVKIPVVKSGVRNYRNDSLKGKIYEVWDTDTEDLEDIFGELTQKSNKKVRAFVSANTLDTVFGKKFTVTSKYFDLVSEDMILQLAGSGKLFKVTKQPDSECCGVVTRCYKTHYQGKVTGYMSCECGENSPTRELGPCGIKEDVSDMGSVFGSFKMKFNKKLSK